MAVAVNAQPDDQPQQSDSRTQLTTSNTRAQINGSRAQVEAENGGNTAHASSRAQDEAETPVNNAQGGSRDHNGTTRSWDNSEISDSRAQSEISNSRAQSETNSSEMRPRIFVISSGDPSEPQQNHFPTYSSRPPLLNRALSVQRQVHALQGEERRTVQEGEGSEGRRRTLVGGTGQPLPLPRNLAVQHMILAIQEEESQREENEHAQQINLSANDIVLQMYDAYLKKKAKKKERPWVNFCFCSSKILIFTLVLSLILIVQKKSLEDQENTRYLGFDTTTDHNNENESCTTNLTESKKFADKMHCKDNRTAHASEEDDEKAYPQFMRKYHPIFILNIVLITLIGGLGNILTLLAVPYSFIKYPLKWNGLWTCSTALMLHMSFCDLCYIIVGMPMVLDIYINQGLIRPRWMCWLSAFGRNLVAYTDFLTLAFIALDRMIYIRNMAWGTQTSSKISSTTSASILCFLAWTLGFITISPIFFEAKEWGVFAYQSKYAFCNTILCKGDGGAKIHYPALVYTVGFFVPFFVVMIAYLVVAPYYLKKYEEDTSRLQEAKIIRLRNRIKKTNRTLVALAAAYTVFTMPLVFIEWMDSFSSEKVPLLTNQWATVLGYNWYWWIFACNFIVYILIDQEFRDMYCQFLSDMRPSFLVKASQPDANTELREMRGKRSQLKKIHRRYIPDPESSHEMNTSSTSSYVVALNFSLPNLLNSTTTLHSWSVPYTNSASSVQPLTVPNLQRMTLPNSNSASTIHTMSVPNEHSVANLNHLSVPNVNSAANIRTETAPNNKLLGRINHSFYHDIFVISSNDRMSFGRFDVRPLAAPPPSPPPEYRETEEGEEGAFRKSNSVPANHRYRSKKAPKKRGFQNHGFQED